MARSRLKDPLKAFRFLVLIPGGTDGDTVAGFTEVTGLEVTMSVDSIRGGGQNDAMQVSPGLPEFNEVTLKRGQVINTENQLATDLFNNWAKQGYHYQAHGYVDTECRRDLKIVQLTAGGQEARVWELVNAFVSYYKPFSDLNAKETGNSEEEIRIRYEGFGNEDGLPPPAPGETLNAILGVT